MISYLTNKKEKDACGHDIVPFESAQEAWFWFMAAQEAKESGARYTAGQSLYPRPCEPVDIIRAVDRLYRNRRLKRDHLLVLRHYGKRHMPPEPHRHKEARAYILWAEALELIGDVLLRKGIVERKTPTSSCEAWRQEALAIAAGGVKGAFA